MEKSVQCIHYQKCRKASMKKCHLELSCSATCDSFKIDTPPLVFLAIFPSEKPLSRLSGLLGKNSFYNLSFKKLYSKEVKLYYSRSPGSHNFQYKRFMYLH